MGEKLLVCKLNHRDRNKELSLGMPPTTPYSRCQSHVKVMHVGRMTQET